MCRYNPLQITEEDKAKYWHDTAINCFDHLISKIERCADKDAILIPHEHFYEFLLLMKREGFLWEKGNDFLSRFLEKERRNESY